MSACCVFTVLSRGLAASPLPTAGVITAACAFAVNLGVENISGFKFWATLTLLERNQAFASYLVYVLINCSLVVASVFITVYYGPAAAGSGIAEVKVGPSLVTYGLPALMLSVCSLSTVIE